MKVLDKVLVYFVTMYICKHKYMYVVFDFTQGLKYQARINAVTNYCENTELLHK